MWFDRETLKFQFFYLIFLRSPERRQSTFQNKEDISCFHNKTKKWEVSKSALKKAICFKGKESYLRCG